MRPNQHHCRTAHFLLASVGQVNDNERTVAMQAIATITVPFFAIIFFSYLAARRRWVPQEAVPAFNGFLLYFAVPAMLFRLVSEMTVIEVAQSGYLLAYSAAGIVTLLVIVTGAVSIFKARLRDAAFY